jgi:transposase
MKESQKDNKEMDKVVKKRLAVIKLAESLGNISEACRKSGMDRTSFYEWKRRYDEKGVDGLKDLLPVHRFHPQTTPAKTAKKILELSLQHPDWGCIKISDQMKESGSYVSSPTVQKILIRENLGFMSQRVSYLENKYINEKMKLTPSQIKVIESYNPAFKERNDESKRPGDIVILDAFPIGGLKDSSIVYLFVTVDSYGMYAIGQAFEDKSSKNIKDFLENKVLSYYKNAKIKIGTMITDNGQEFSLEKAPAINEFLKENGIKQKWSTGKRANNNGFMERFRLIFQETFLKGSSRKKVYPNLKTLNSQLADWFKNYNQSYGIEGYRNLGKTPSEFWKGK